ncbi:MAG: hypothetical protein SOR93_14155 [Clostridiales Family XIII bacterium]|uniref:hypothetical protein n=1 Tax=Hominibacterium faecale TaxID=2839743 RepID=UPI0022B2A86B|nr:hypothetical protein [Hominibacterium faecale]MCI7300996.1 hypothetical protein [Clostridia bacterium]MDY3012381.1 hypothetical protein [Clostridiales Family XIII bacterium]
MKTEKQKQVQKDRRTSEIMLYELSMSTAPVNIDWNMKEKYIQAFMTGLKAAREEGCYE